MANENSNSLMGIAVVIALVGGLYLLGKMSLSTGGNTCSGNNVSANSDGSCNSGYAQSATQSGCCAPIPAGDVPEPCQVGFVKDPTIIGYCMPINGAINISANPTFVNSGQSVTLTAKVTPVANQQAVDFSDSNGNSYGSSLTNANGVATLVVKLTNSTSSNETIVFYASTNISGNAMQSNGFTVVVAPATTKSNSNYGLTCTRSGFYVCQAGYGIYSEVECNTIYANEIGKSCRGVVESL